MCEVYTGDHDCNILGELPWLIIKWYLNFTYNFIHLMWIKYFQTSGSQNFSKFIGLTNQFISPLISFGKIGVIKLFFLQDRCGVGEGEELIER